ncbi:glycosyltransferase family 2 protein [Plesiomonas shigelloides]|uniref:glycosyltransferase family 2 protein n=1 Tax=Plesiomonas shigelloides TaxID=703 RepID=UPI0015B6E07F|nr:glycosyltransferase family 2 protein [Plesiomonas shigelloides]
MEQIILSVIIAVHNTEEYVEQSLKSLDQALHGYKLSSTVEAIIVDDASSDNSVSIINNYKPDNFKKRFFSVNYNNVGKVKRFAFKQCQGNYITILDSDDAFRNNALTLITKTLASNKYDMVITPISEVYNNFGNASN